MKINDEVIRMAKKIERMSPESLEKAIAAAAKRDAKRKAIAKKRREKKQRAMDKLLLAKAKMLKNT